MITVASARLVDIAAAAGIITAQTATPASTALRAAATAWNDAGLAWPHLLPIAGQRIPTLLQTHHRLGQQLHRRFTDIANPDGIYQQDLNPAAAAPGWLAATLHAAHLLRDVSARYVQAAETIINAGAMPIRADHLMANLRHTAAYAGADSITVATPTPADIRRRRWLTAAGHATTAARTGPSL